MALDDQSNIGLGDDGDVHSDPYCARIAPLGSYEARHGEFCDLCYQRQAEREREESMITLSEWLGIYEASGELPPAGVLVKHLAEHDAADEAAAAIVRQLVEALEEMKRVNPTRWSYEKKAAEKADAALTAACAWLEQEAPK